MGEEQVRSSKVTPGSCLVRSGQNGSGGKKNLGNGINIF